MSFDTHAQELIAAIKRSWGNDDTYIHTHIHTRIQICTRLRNRRKIRLRLFIGGKISRRRREMKSHSWQLTGRNGTTGEEETIGGIHQPGLID